MKKLSLFMLAFTISISAFCQGNLMNQDELKAEGLALTPPMGWNSWNKFACDVNEQLIRETTDYMVSSGMKDAGNTKKAFKAEVPAQDIVMLRLSR